MWSGLVGIVLSVALALLIPPRYQSTTRLMPPDTQAGTSLSALAAKAGIAGGPLTGDLMGWKSPGALFVEILRGRTVQDRIIERFDLRRVYRRRYWREARQRLAGYTQLSEDRKSGVITIRVTDGNRQRAAAMAAAYVEELDNLVAHVSTSAARRERTFIEQRLKTVKQDLDRASQQLSDYSSRNMALDISAQSKAMFEGAGRLQGELIAARSELQALEQIYTGNNIRVLSLKARIGELQRQLHKLGGQPVTPPADKGELPPIRTLPLLGLRWTELYREAQMQETIYELLNQQYELAKIQEAKEIPTVKVLDAAEMPEKKSFPPRFLLIVMGAAASLMAAAGVVLGQSAWSGVSAQDPRKRLVHDIGCRFRASATELRAMKPWRRAS